MCGKEGLIYYNDAAYSIDMDRFMEFVCDIDNDDEYHNTTVTQTYAVEPGEDDMSLLSKEIMENRLNGNDTTIQLRYDFAKTLLSAAIDGNDYPAGVDGFNFGRKMAINTLLEEGIIRKIEKNL